MPILFEVNHDDSYYIAKWEGRVTDKSLSDGYRAFFESQEWVPGYDSLVDLSELDATDITQTGLQHLAELVKSTFAPHGIHPRIAVYAPHDLPYGLSRMYSAGVESFETHRTFRDKSEALEWLRDRRQSEGTGK